MSGIGPAAVPPAACPTPAAKVSPCRSAAAASPAPALNLMKSLRLISLMMF
jgi:hypothetical protein